MKLSIKEHTALFLLLALLVLAFVPFMPITVYAFGGGGHYWAAEAAGRIYGAGSEGNVPPMDPTMISRNRQIPLLPELTIVTSWYNAKVGCCDEEDAETRSNWDWLCEGAIRMDDFDSTTLHHFWYAEEGLHEDPNDDYVVDNAWETEQKYWKMAVSFWSLGNLGAAYTYLGYAMHLIQDMGQPAHSNEDMHPGDGLSDDDSLEDWMSDEYITQNYKWTEADLNIWPGPILYPKSNTAIVNEMLAATDWVGSGEVLAEPDLMDGTLVNAFNMPQVIYSLYYVNQVGGYFASDDEDGNTSDPIGWLNGFPGFPTQLWNADADEYVSAQDSAGLGGLDDNDGCDCDDDGDLSLISQWAYRESFRATPGIIDLFRRTVDNVPPDTTVDMTRLDGKTVKEWNNSPVTVKLTGATDYGNPGLRVSGVWKVWGLYDGNPPADADNPSWVIAEDGKHTVNCLSTDMIGNVDTKDIQVWFDGTPPEVAFPDLRPNYLTSENFVATWVASDATSGVKSETAYLDGNLVTKGQVFNLAQLAGLHTLRVIVYDNADNVRDVSYNFEVWIIARGWSFSVIVNDKTEGNAMSCVVEFPAPYKVGLIDLTKSTLAVKGTLDLTKSDPVVGQTAVLQGQLLGGVGDNDRNGIRDRKIQFRKDYFVKALGGQIGNIPAVVSGGLLPNGQPRFIAAVTVPVFKSSKK